MSVSWEALCEPPDPHEVEVLTRAGGIAYFDRMTRLNLGIPGEEFLRRYDAGEYDAEDSPTVGRLILLIPFARDVSS